MNPVDIVTRNGSALERFFAQIEFIPEAGCWIHMGPIVGDGYSKFMLRHKSLRAHRWAYERFKGPIPHGMVVCHSCDVPSCVNPAHLFVASQAENIADKVKKGRQAKGERMHAAKLTEERVRQIRQELSNYRVGMYTALGKMFGVDRAIIRRIHCGSVWRHVA